MAREKGSGNLKASLGIKFTVFKNIKKLTKILSADFKLKSSKNRYLLRTALYRRLLDICCVSRDAKKPLLPQINIKKRINF